MRKFDERIIQQLQLDDPEDKRGWWDREPIPDPEIPVQFGVTKSTVTAGFENIDVKITFQTLELDPIGEHLLWYKWVFFNDEETCQQLPGTCLQDAIFDALDGNEESYKYTVYYNWNDFYDIKEVETIFWIMLATSWLGWIALPAELVFTGIFIGYFIFFAIIEW